MRATRPGATQTVLSQQRLTKIAGDHEGKGLERADLMLSL